MAKYKVVKPFKDKETGGRLALGDVWEVSDKERISLALKLGLIEPIIETAVKPKYVGGGWYELPSGEKVQGKENAMRMGGD